MHFCFHGRAMDLKPLEVLNLLGLLPYICGINATVMETLQLSGAAACGGLFRKHNYEFLCVGLLWAIENLHGFSRFQSCMC